MTSNLEKHFTVFEEEKDKEYHLASMEKYVKQKQELDIFLEKIISPFIQNKKLKILDACCGIGHICFNLTKITPNSIFIGIDQKNYLIKRAKELCKDFSNISFYVDDIYRISKNYPKHFDISISWKILINLPHYKEMIKTLFSMTKKHIFLCSPFYDGDIDFETKVRMYNTEQGKDEGFLYWNVYSLPRFKEFVYNLGAKNIEVYDFELDVDVPKNLDTDKMGSYTVKLENGQRLTISGAIIMSWKIIRIDL